MKRPFLSICSVILTITTNRVRLLLGLLLVSMSLTINAQNDSIQNVKLQEVTVLADQKEETPTHTVFVPSSSDKAHSTNAFELLHAMNISGLDISFDSKQISNNRGQEVVLCIDGIEVSAEEVAALRSKNITSVEFQRNPTGKYLGKDGVLNFKTMQYDYGGNVYLSAKESFLYNNGDYLASADFSHKKNKLSLIYNGNWNKTINKQTSCNEYYFNNGKLSLSFNGFYVHTIFDPSNKNDLSIPTSFFEVTRGNPDFN